VNEEPGTEIEAPGASDEEDLSRLPAVGPPFGPAFFATILVDRVRAACEQQPDHIPVVELQLADGLALDLCHVPGIEPQWLAVQVYRDRETCEEMDLVLVPYALITRVTVSMWHPNQRPIGFQLTGPSAPAAGAD
jgi:hypothetical protein